MKKALITGITGQDGAYLAEFLLNKNYIVYGLYRRTSSPNWWRINELCLHENPNFYCLECDITDLGSILKIFERCMPNEVYNLAAQSFVGISFDQPNLTTTVNSLGTLNLLEAIRFTDKNIRFYQAGTSEMFGKVVNIPQNEFTPFYPRSPYGVSKLYAHWITINYRESYDIFASNGILFNHESPLRGLDFVTRKISNGVANLSANIIPFLELGNLSAKRDWGYAKEYVDGMWRILQLDEADNFVLGTGTVHSVRDFLISSFRVVGIDIEFRGSGPDEIGINSKNGKTLVKVSEKFFRPSEVDLLLADPTYASTKLNWKAQMKLDDLCKLMVDADLRRLK